MSWADENLDWSIDDELFEELEELWYKGKHQDKSGKKYKLKEMTDSHLINTIKYFNEIADTRPLIKEAKRRKLN